MEIFDTLWTLVLNVGDLVVELLAFALKYGVWIAWFSWWLFGVDWKKTWPVLARGGWIPVVLLVIVSALVWSRISPATCSCLGMSVSNFWWQLADVSLLAGATLFCGWLQLVMKYTPEETNFDPPPEADGGMHHHGLVHN